jgi:predicted DNA-binding transcriptional regulator AlpA
MPRADLFGGISVNTETKPICGPVFIEPLLTRAELGEVLKLSNRTITRLLTTGGLPMPIQVGQSFRWRASEIAAFIQDQNGTMEQAKNPSIVTLF